MRFYFRKSKMVMYMPMQMRMGCVPIAQNKNEPLAANAA